MSKTALKKELKNLNEEQVKEMLLDLYSSCKEAREYLDFFIDPRVNELYDKYFSEIKKEALRSKHGRSTARISRIRSSIKRFLSFKAGAEFDISLMEQTINLLQHVEKYRYTSEYLSLGIIKLADEMLKYGEHEQMFDQALAAFDRIIKYESQLNSTRETLKALLDEFLSITSPLRR